MAWMAAGSAAASVVGGIMANRAQAKSLAEAREITAQGMAELEKLGMPPDLSARVIMEQYAQQGLLTPELENEIALSESAYNQIKEDPSLRESQMDALNMLKQRGSQGFSPTERAELNSLRQEAQRDARGKIEQIQQQMAARGQAGSGTELAAALSEGQGAAERQSGEADRLMAMAAQNALNAISQGANVATGIRSQDYGVASDKANAQDMISRFNAENAAAVQQRNVGSKNAAQAANLSEKQRMADTNTQVENLERQRMNEAKRDFYNDKMNLATAKNNIRAGQASQAVQAGQNKANMFQGIGTTVGGSLAGYGAQQNANEQAALDREAYKNKTK